MEADQSEAQQITENLNATVQHPTRDNHSKDLWQSQKKKHFRGFNQRSKQQKFKQSTEKLVDATVTNATQNSVITPNIQFVPPTTLENKKDHNLTDVEANVEKVHDQGIHILHQPGTPKGVALPHILHECSDILGNLIMDNLTPTNTPQQCLQKDMVVQIESPVVNSSDDKEGSKNKATN